MSQSNRFPLRRGILTAVLAGGLLAVPLVASAATGSFTDVPDTNTFYNDIEAVKAKGVTSGCTATTYCPKDYVTREQMAAFLNRLGALSPSKVPVANADRVDGFDANDLLASAYVRYDTITTIVNTNTVFFTLSITAPTNGYVTLSSTLTSSATSNCTLDCSISARIHDVSGGFNSGWSYSDIKNLLYTNQANTARFFVTPGEHQFQLVMVRTLGYGTIKGFFGDMTAIFTPFGSTGQVPTSGG